MNMKYLKLAASLLAFGVAGSLVSLLFRPENYALMVLGVMLVPLGIILSNGLIKKRDQNN